MFAKLLALFHRKEKQAQADFSNLVQRIRAKVVTGADVVFVSIKGADFAELERAKRVLRDIAPEVKFIVHDDRVKVSAAIKKLEDKVKAKLSKGRRAR